MDFYILSSERKQTNVDETRKKKQKFIPFGSKMFINWKRNKKKSIELWTWNAFLEKNDDDDDDDQ